MVIILNVTKTAPVLRGLHLEARDSPAASGKFDSIEIMLFPLRTGVGLCRRNE